MREKREFLKRSSLPPRTAPTTSENVAAEEITTGLSQRGLGRRLGMSDVAIAKAKKTKDADGFAAWSKEKDPKGQAWEYRDGKYYAMK